MNVLIMGEESQSVCLAFLAKGHNAYSCDLQDCSGNRPDRHIKGDMFKAFHSRSWDLIICHPTCTYMCNSGVLRLYKDGKKINGIDSDRWAKMEASAHEFKQLLSLPCGRIALENPVMHCHATRIIGAKYSQTIQPFQFGHPESKRTALWLVGLPILMPTNILTKSGHWDNQTPSGQNKLAPGPERAKLRSKTYSGIATAMAEQWG